MRYDYSKTSSDGLLYPRRKRLIGFILPHTLSAIATQRICIKSIKTGQMITMRSLSHHMSVMRLERPTNGICHKYIQSVFRPIKRTTGLSNKAQPSKCSPSISSANENLWWVHVGKHYAEQSWHFQEVYVWICLLKIQAPRLRPHIANVLNVIIYRAMCFCQDFPKRIEMFVFPPILPTRPAPLCSICSQGTFSARSRPCGT